MYNAAALEILNPNFERLAENMATPNQEQPQDEPLVPENLSQPTAQPKRPRGGGGFVDAWRT